MFLFLFPPPYFPSELNAPLAALAETTGVFPVGRLVIRPPVYLSDGLTTGSHCLPGRPLNFSSCLSFVQSDCLSFYLAGCQFLTMIDLGKQSPHFPFTTESGVLGMGGLSCQTMRTYTQYLYRSFNNDTCKTFEILLCIFWWFLLLSFRIISRLSWNVLHYLHVQQHIRLQQVSTVFSPQWMKTEQIQ